MHKYLMTGITVVISLGAAGTGGAQTTINSTTSTHSSSTISNTTNSTASSSISSSQTSSSGSSNIGSDSQYLSRVGPRFDRFTGSRANTRSLVHGLRTGSRIRLTGGDTVAFTPASGAMSYGNITRAVDLAQHDLAAAGIRHPTPYQIKAALNGGTISTPRGERVMHGVLQLRSQGLAWNEIEQTLGFQPRSSRNRSTAGATVTTPGVTTSAGGGQGATAGGASVTFGEGGMRVQAGDASVTTGR